MSIPATPGVVSPGPSGDFSFGGLNWRKRSASGDPAGIAGGSNSWSPSNVVVNGDGTITLRRTSNNSAEMESTGTGYGYGTYYVVVSKNMTTLPSGAVFGGLFTYDNANSPASHREIDVCETSAWDGDTIHLEPGYFTPDGVSHVLQEIVARNETVETHCLIWEPGKLTFRHWAGTDITATPFATQTATNQIAAPGNENILINVWNFFGNPIFDATILDFSFIPRGFVIVPPTQTPVSVSFVLPYDVPRKVANLISFPWEADGSALADVVATNELPFESLTNLVNSFSMPWESAGQILLSVSALFMMPWEAEAAGSVITPPPPVQPPPSRPAPVLSGRSSLRVISELPSTRLHVDAISPRGRHYRWGSDEPNPENVPGNMRFSSTAPGGFESFDCVLPRKPGIDYEDLERLSTVRTIGAGGEIAGEFRLEKTPLTSGDQMSISPSAVGWQAALEDNQAASMIFIDRDMTRWGATSTRRQQLLADPNLFDPDKGSFEYHGSDIDLTDPNNPVFTPPTLKLAIGTLTQPTGVPGYPNSGGGAGGTSYLYPISIAEAQYDAGAGNDIAQVRAILLDYSPVMGAGWIHQFWLDPSVDVTGAGGNTTGPLPFAKGSAILLNANAQPRRVALCQLFFSREYAGNANWNVIYAYIRVIGDHGLEIHPGTGVDDEGVLASDVVKYVVRNFVPALNVLDENIDTGSFVIPQLAFPDKTTAGEMVRQSIRFGYPAPPDFFVWEDRQFHLHTLNTKGRKWRARIGPSQLTETGPDVARVFNSVVVQFQDVDNAVKTVGPPGSGADFPVYDSLIDNDPSNPANEAGLVRRYLLSVNSTATPGLAAKIGETYIALIKQLDTSGSAKIVGHVLDDHGIMHPAWAVRAGDQISFVDAADFSYRRITRADYDDGSRTCSIDLDAPPEGLQGVLERLGVGLVDLGLGS